MSSTWSYREEPNCRDVRYFGRSQSDFFDECGPALRRVLSLMFVLCNLSPVRAGTRRALGSKFFLCVRSFDDATGTKLTSYPRDLSRWFVVYFLGPCSGATIRVRIF